MTILKDESAWRDIQDALAHEFGIQTSLERAFAKWMLINGVEYYVRAKMQSLGSDSQVLLVAVEPCLDSPFPTTKELHRAFGLTPTEARVARLLSERKSNREIMAELGMGTHTARRHTEKVLNKLGVHQRAAVRTTMTHLLKRTSGS